MKKIISIILTLSFLLTAGCSSEDKNKTYDEEFLTDFSTVLQNYWADEGTDAEEGSAEYKTHLQTLVSEQKDALDSYRERKFADEQLKNYAVAYLDSLNAFTVAFDNYDSDYDSFESDWADATQSQMNALRDLYGNYDLQLSDENITTMERMVTNLYINENAEEFFDMINAGTFEPVENTNGTMDITYTITNTMDHDFTVLMLGTFLVSDSSIVDVFVYDADNWKAGEERVFTFTSKVGMTDFDSYFTYWY